MRLMKNHHGGDCAYPGLELLPDGTFVTTTYGHCVKGEQPFIAGVHFDLADLDEKAGVKPADGRRGSSDTAGGSYWVVWPVPVRAARRTVGASFLMARVERRQTRANTEVAPTGQQPCA